MTPVKDLNLSMWAMDFKDFMDLARCSGMLREDVADASKASVNLVAKLSLKGPYLLMMLRYNNAGACITNVGHDVNNLMAESKSEGI